MTLIPRVPEAISSSGRERLRHHTELVSSILNALLRDGVITQTDGDAWTTSIFIGQTVTDGTAGAVLIVGNDGTLSQVTGGLTGFF